MKCTFCGNTIGIGRGKMFVKVSGEVLNFCNSKCQVNWKMGRDNKRVKWTTKFVKGTVSKKAEKAE